jgi:capsular polysaccharide biosynthesis protein
MEAAESLVMVHSVERLSARYAGALAVALAAFAAFVTWSALTPTTYRAETAIVVGVGNGPLRPGAPGATLRLAQSLDDLVESNLIASDVVANLKLREPPRSLLRRVSVTVPQPGLLRVRVRDRDRVRAEAIAQSIGLVFTHLVKLRFGDTRPPLRATVWDPAHAAGSTGPAWARNLGIAAALALLAFAAAAATSHGGRLVPVPPVVPAPSPVPVVVPLPTPEPEPDPVREPEPAPPPDPAPAAVQPEPEPAPEPEPVPVAGDGAWTLPRLERLVDHHGPEFPLERVDEWRYYLIYLRDYAEVDGRLSDAFDGLVLDTFGDLLDREERPKRAPAQGTEAGVKVL